MIPGQSVLSRSRLDRLVVSNILEWGLQPERQSLPEFTPPARGERFPAEDAALAWSGDRKLVLTRYPVDELLAADLSVILGYQSLACRALTSAQPGNSICTDLAADERTLAQVAELLDDGSADGPVARVTPEDPARFCAHGRPPQGPRRAIRGRWLRMAGRGRVCRSGRGHRGRPPRQSRPERRGHSAGHALGRRIRNLELSGLQRIQV